MSLLNDILGLDFDRYQRQQFDARMGREELMQLPWDSFKQVLAAKRGLETKHFNLWVIRRAVAHYEGQEISDANLQQFLRLYQVPESYLDEATATVRARIANKTTSKAAELRDLKRQMAVMEVERGQGRQG